MSVVITGELAAEMLAEAKRRQADRAERMPAEADALRALHDAYTRLKELGWNDAIYCPKDGSTFKVIEAGSTGVHDCIYHGEWPTGTWWIAADGDSWPSRPILYKDNE